MKPGEVWITKSILGPRSKVKIISIKSEIPDDRIEYGYINPEHPNDELTDCLRWEFISIFEKLYE